ncbi:MAG: hypothetical protein IPM54_42915 [Polyangiaceae bacterium]|nr:hypothetical protein [Polyangiaceae bacterium]
MPTFLSRRNFLGPAILLTALLSGCRDDPAPAPDGRASQAPSADKPTAEKSTPSAAATPRKAVAPVVKPALNVPSATPSASAAPSVSAAVEALAAPAEPALDCDTILTAEDVFAACNVKVEAPADQPTDDIGAERTCSRRFSSKEAGTLSVLIVRHANSTEATERYYQETKAELSKPEPIKDVGDLARRYVKRGVSGDPIYTVEAVKGQFNVSVFNPKITLGAQTVGPVCDEAALEKLLAVAIKRIP